MRLHNRSRCAILADRAVIAASAPVPPPGLILQAPPKAGEALVIWTGGRPLATGRLWLIGGARMCRSCCSATIGPFTLGMASQ